MANELPDGWRVEGLWSSGHYDQGYDFDARELAHADAIIVSYHADDWGENTREYVTFHGADDYETLSDLIGDIDADTYFG